MAITLKDFNKYKNDASLYATLNDENKKKFWDYGTSQGLVPMHLLNDNMKSEVSKYTSGSYKPEIGRKQLEGDKAYDETGAPVYKPIVDKFATKQPLGADRGVVKQPILTQTQSPTTVPTTDSRFSLANRQQNLKESALDTPISQVNRPLSSRLQEDFDTLGYNKPQNRLEAGAYGVAEGIKGAFGGNLLRTKEEKKIYDEANRFKGITLPAVQGGGLSKRLEEDFGQSKSTEAVDVSARDIGQGVGMLGAEAVKYMALAPILASTKVGGAVVKLADKLGLGKFGKDQLLNAFTDMAIRTPSDIMETVEAQDGVDGFTKRWVMNSIVDAAMNFGIGKAIGTFEELASNPKVIKVLREADVTDDEIVEAVATGNLETIKNKVNIKGKEYEVSKGTAQGSIPITETKPSLTVASGQKVVKPEFTLKKPTENLYTPTQPRDVFSIEDRATDTVGDKTVKAYQVQNEEVKPYFKKIATELLNDMEGTLPGGRSAVWSTELGQWVNTSTKRQSSELLGKILDETTDYAKVKKALERIVEGKGAESNATSKRIELMMDDALSQGYKTYDGVKINPNQDYINAKALGEFEATAPPIKIKSPLLKRNLKQVPTVTTRKELPRLEDNPFKEKDYHPFDEEVKSEMQDIRRQKYIDELVKKDDTMMLKRKNSPDGDFVIYHPSTKDGKIQLSYFKKGEPTMDAQFQSKEELAKELFTDGYGIPVKETVTTRKELPKLTASMGKEPVKLEGDYKLAPDFENVPKITKGIDVVAETATKERGFSKNVATDTNRPDSLRESFDKDKLFYDKLANKTTLESAQARFDRGYEEAIKDFNMTKNDLRADNVPLSKLIADEATRRGDMQKAREIISDIAESLTTAGQFSQAAKILRESNDPATILMFVERELKKLNQQGSTRYGKKWNKIDLTDDELGMIERFTKNATEEQKEKLFEDLFASVSTRIPTTNREKFDSLRKMAMLFNPKTHIRNIVGNGIMAGVKKISDTIATGLEKKFVPADLRTKSFSASKQLKNTAQSYFDSNKKTLLDGDRWEVFGVKSPFADKRIFKTGWLQTLNDISKKTLEGEDVIFFKKHFVNDLAGFMNARGLSEPTDEAIKYATRRAQEATFREANELAQAINALKGTKYGLIVEAAIPFTKTPANILKSGVDYSPIGVVKSMFELANKAEPTQVIETLSKGLTGTGLALTGYFMATNGMARGAYEKGKAEGLSTATGELPNSIILPNGSYTIDWAQPAAIPFFMGVAVAEEMKKNKNADAVELGYKALKAGGDSLINSSMLKNVRELLGGEYGSPAEKLMGLPIEYAKQILPTLGGQIARSVDPVKREKDYSNLGSQLLTDAQSRIPLATKGLPAKYDLLGQPQTYGKFGLINTLNQFLNPGTVGTATQDPIIKEISRLYDTQGANAIPRTSISKFTEKGEYKLNNVEKSEFMRIMGEYTKNSLKAKFNTPEYKNSTDAEKVKIIKGINDDGYDKAKSAIISMRGAK